jgi:peptide deformylase
MILPVRQVADPVLRQIAQAIPLKDLSAPWLEKIIKEMSVTLAGCVDGVALAAPQIGELWRLFIVGERAFPKRDTSKPWPGDLVFINPVIVRQSRRQIDLTEGCLSVRNLYGTTRRHERVSVEAYDQLGHKFVRHASGLLAQVFQHEIQHLDGILFIDQAQDLHEVVS